MITPWLDKIFHTASEAFQNCLKRFPVTVCFIFALTAFLFYSVSEWHMSQPQAALLYYLSVGTLLSLTLHLWCEEIKRKALRWTAQIAGHALLIADALFLAYGALDNSITEITIAHAAGVLTVGISVFFLSFLKEKNDVASWNFALHSFNLLAASLFLGLVMYGSISLLVSSLPVLFGIHISFDCYLYLGIICCIWLSLMLFIGRLPQGAQKHDTEVQANKFLNGIIAYLFLPLTAGYLLVLYVYAIRIIANWQLPNGWVSWLTIAIMAICIVIEFCLYPTRMVEKKKKVELLARWLPVLILPLLLLMTIGIIRRISDYGVSINRLYLIILNGWFYVVCIGLFINKARRIHWIPISFALLFLLTSALPVNVANYTKKSIHNAVLKEIKANCNKKLPMNQDDYIDFLASLPKEQAIQINSRLIYLSSRFNENCYTDILKDGNDVYNSYYYSQLDTDTVEEIEVDTTNIDNGFVKNRTYQWNIDDNGKIDISEGYTAFYNVNETATITEEELKNNSIDICLEIEDSDIDDTIHFDTEMLKKLDLLTRKKSAVELPCQSGENKFMLNGFFLSQTGNDESLWILNYSGYLFNK